MESKPPGASCVYVEIQQWVTHLSWWIYEIAVMLSVKSQNLLGALLLIVVELPNLAKCPSIWLEHLLPMKHTSKMLWALKRLGLFHVMTTKLAQPVVVGFVAFVAWA